MKNEMLWVERYRPKTIEECILPQSIKKTFQEYVNKKTIPNLLLSGGGGVGKTSVAKALCEEVGCDYIMINGSSENGIDVLRNKISNYASSVSLSGGRKVVIIDEADYMNCLEENETIRVGTVDDWVAVSMKDLPDSKFSIVSFNLDSGVLENDFAEIVSDLEQLVYDVVFESGNCIRATSDHPFIVRVGGEYVEQTISDGLVGYSVVCVDSDNFNDIVKSVTPLGYKRVINIQVEKNKTFISGCGIVTHNCNSLQPALRASIEEFSNNCSFIFTCNFKNRIIEPLHSRCAVIDFKISKEDKPKLITQFFKRVCHILDIEKIEYNKDVVAQIISKYYPDNRRVLNELQRYSVSGSIDVGILNNSADANITALVKSLKEKNFSNVRKWVVDNSDVDSNTFFRKLYDTCYDFLKPHSIPQLILLIAKYQYQSSFVADHEINNIALLVEIMVDCEFL